MLGHPLSVAAGAASQKRAMTLLKNDEHILPLQGQPKVFVKNIDPLVAAQYAEVVATPEEAEVAILRLMTPWIPVETKNPFARDFHHGDLDFKGVCQNRNINPVTDRAHDCSVVSGSSCRHSRNQR